MAYFADHALPTSLIDLRNKHGYVNQVISYCETAYLTQDKTDIEQQTKEYLTDALSAVVKDIEVISNNLNSYLELQNDCLASLDPKLKLIKTRLQLMKSTKAQNRLARSRRVVNVVKPEQKKEGLSEGDVSYNSRKMGAYTRVPLEERLKALDGVGHCLSKG